MAGTTRDSGSPISSSDGGDGRRSRCSVAADSDASAPSPNLRTHAEVVQHSCRTTSGKLLNRCKSFYSFLLFFFLLYLYAPQHPVNPLASADSEKKAARFPATALFPKPFNQPTPDNLPDSRMTNRT
jgi:hypothetical protein